jgi:hypothetical protein
MHPGFVNDYLMTILSVIGENHASITNRKNTRDDVLWDDTKYCWRRQPFWLFCKVAVLRTLLLTLPPEEAQEQYKLFMLDVVARLLERYCEMSVDPQRLSTVHAKLARRALKFEQRYGRSPGAHILRISSNAGTILKKIWAQHAGVARNIEKVGVQNWVDASSLALPGVRAKLTRTLSPSECARKMHNFTPKALPRCAQNQSVIPSLLSSVDEFPVTELVDVETWVEHNLAAWTKLALSQEIVGSYDKLEGLIRNYWSRASLKYRQSPPSLSHALLVVLELWVALDKICVSQIPLMAGYPPALPVNVVQPLLLSKAHQMQRLFAEPTKDSLCVRYYATSQPLQDLHEKTDKYDPNKRAQKIHELATAMERYKKLLADAKMLECNFYADSKGKRVHSPNCTKCQKGAQAAAMTIKYVEESLPRDAVQHKAVIFELQIPAQFAAWRDATWFILNDIGQRKASTGGPSHTTVLQYSQLKGYATRKTMRITLGSFTKPTAVIAHYRDKALPAKINEICVSNNLKYKFRDTSTASWVAWPGAVPDFKAYCTLSLYLRGHTQTSTGPHALASTPATRPSHANTNATCASRRTSILHLAVFGLENGSSGSTFCANWGLQTWISTTLP